MMKLKECEDLYKYLTSELISEGYTDIILSVDICVANVTNILVNYTLLENGKVRDRCIPFRMNLSLYDTNLRDVILTIIKNEVTNGVIENVNI